MITEKKMGNGRQNLNSYHLSLVAGGGQADTHVQLADLQLHRGVPDVLHHEVAELQEAHGRAHLRLVRGLRHRLGASNLQSSQNSHIFEYGIRF